MDPYTFTFFCASVCAALIVGYLLGLRTTRKAHELMQRKLVDAFQEVDWSEKKYKVLKQKYNDKLSMINDLEETNGLLRKANEEIHHEGFIEGVKQGKLNVIKELGKSLIDESASLNRGNVVTKDPVPNQIVNSK